MRHFSGVMSLYDIKLFHGLTKKDQKEIMELLPKETRIDKGDSFYGKKGKGSMGIMVSGRAKCYVRDSGVILRTFSGGDVFGAVGIFQDEPITDIVASAPCSVIFIDRKLFKELLEKYPSFSLNFIRFLTARIAFLNKRIELYSMDNAEGRVYSQLLSMASEEGWVSIGNMSLFAKTLGISRSSLYRSVDSLKEKGIITKENEKIYIKELLT